MRRWKRIFWKEILWTRNPIIILSIIRNIFEIFCHWLLVVYIVRYPIILMIQVIRFFSRNKRFPFNISIRGYWTRSIFLSSTTLLSCLAFFTFSIQIPFCSFGTSSHPKFCMMPVYDQWWLTFIYQAAIFISFIQPNINWHSFNIIVFPCWIPFRLILLNYCSKWIKNEELYSIRTGLIEI